MTRKEALTDLLEKVKAGGTGWLEIKPDLFRTQDQMIEFMAMRGKKKRVEFLQALISEEATS